MTGVRLILGIHDHQPVGNFDGVFEDTYRDSYRPFLDAIEGYDAIPIALHTSGPLLEWLVELHPEYIERVRALVDAGRVEILGGGYYEPILTMIPHRDRVGQIRDYSRHLEDLFGQPIRGMWVPERVWEPGLVPAIVEAGIEFTVLDDFHFSRTGLGPDDLYGYYLTEDQGRILKVFPNCERMRYLIPWEEPHDAYEFLRDLAGRRPGATVVCADDGEKFGGWPKTHEHIFTKGWLRRFLDMIAASREWLKPSTFAQAVDGTLPLGKVYLPDASYREMTEWVLPAREQLAYRAAIEAADGDEVARRLKPFARAGGSWRNFKAKYPETDEMYTRMLAVSDRLAAAPADADPDYLDVARQELYRGQCNCPYWHGAFGGLYLPHLRNAIYKHLIAADGALDEALGKSGPRASLEVADYNLDARQEVRLENDHLVAFIRPAAGGHLYELDVRRVGVNLLATLDRRPEPYHAKVAAAAAADAVALPEDPDEPSNLHDRVILKQPGLDRLLTYDDHPRKALVDHFYPLDATLDDLVANRAPELGDFVAGTYLMKVQRTPERVALFLERPGRADGHAIRISKTITVEPGRSGLDVVYALDDLPEGVPLRFAVELNLAAMAGHAPDRYYGATDGDPLGNLSTPLDLGPTDGLDLTDEWLDLRVGLRWSRPAGVWAFPIATVSQSEGGFEAVYQSSAVVPHWVVTADSSRRWEVRLSLALDRARPAPAPRVDRPTIRRADALATD